MRVSIFVLACQICMSIGKFANPLVKTHFLDAAILNGIKGNFNTYSNHFKKFHNVEKIRHWYVRKMSYLMKKKQVHIIFFTYRSISFSIEGKLRNGKLEAKGVAIKVESTHLAMKWGWQMRKVSFFCLCVCLCLCFSLCLCFCICVCFFSLCICIFLSMYLFVYIFYRKGRK